MCLLYNSCIIFKKTYKRVYNKFKNSYILIYLMKYHFYTILREQDCSV